MLRKHYYVYIVTNKMNEVFYIGVTNNLERRISEHKLGAFEGFTKKYNCKKLVFYEIFNDINCAIAREKKLKNWHRQWKIDLIQETNPNFEDLSLEWM